jgi:signal peptidase I
MTPLIEGGGHIYINDQVLQEAKISGRVYYPAGPYGEEEVVVPEDMYFMLGDNSLNSRDSRFWGFVPRENILGKAVAIYWPPRRIGGIN